MIVEINLFAKNKSKLKCNKSRFHASFPTGITCAIRVVGLETS